MALEDPNSQTGSEISTEATPSLPHDSMVTVRLSEPPEVTINMEEQTEKETTITASPPEVPDEEGSDSDKILTIQTSNLGVVSQEDDSPKSTVDEVPQIIDTEVRRGSESSVSSGEGQVNWEELEKTEEMEPRDQDSEDVSPAIFYCGHVTDNSVHRITTC